MKIAQVSATFPPYMAGTGNVCYHYAIELAKLGHDVTVFTSRYPDEDFSYPDSITVKRYKPWFRIGNAPFIPQLLNLRGFDIIHLHYPFFFGGELIYLVSLLTNQKYVISYHNDVHLSGIISPLLNCYKRLGMKVIVNGARKVYVSSLDFGTNCELITKMDVPSRNLVEIPIGIDIERFHQSTDSNGLKSKYNIHGKKVVLFVAALDKAHYYKGLEYLLKSYRELNAKDTVLMIVGDGDLKEQYIELSQTLNIQDKIFFVGQIDNNDLPKYYNISDLLVLPSTIESFGLVLIEAMACGKPVIASDLPGVRTVVEDGINGFLIKPKDWDDLTNKMRYLLENDDIKEKFGRAGRKKSEEKYSWDRIGKELEMSYLEKLN